jgi:tRNA U34 2-thiouridine synthase MnmA/TrmU
MEKKAVGLLSGGLDSTLAVKLMLEQGVEVFVINFITPFCTCTRKGCKLEARRVSEEFSINLKVNPVGEEYIAIVKNPKYGYGKNMNPCIDCRIFMFSRAKDYMEEIKASFIFTGEVLGERPMSQRLSAMRLIERESGLEDRILRPLSAGLLKPTIPEREGIVDRARLFSIQGRSRKPQMKLARELGIVDYPCPAGGCRLTDSNFAERLRESFRHGEESLGDINLLKYGRHFRLQDRTKVIVGRNENENALICSLKSVDDLLFEVIDSPGPVTLLRGNKNPESILFAAALCARYSDGEGKLRVGYDDNKVITAEPITEDELQKQIIR